MARKLFSYFLILIFSACWLAGCNHNWLPETLTSVWFPDSYRYGDLYQMAYLGDFKERTKPCDKKYANPATKQNLDLYIIGDSFTEDGRMNSDDFVAQKLTRVHWADSAEIRLDRSKRNVLILETVERHFREHFVKNVNNFQVVNRLPLAFAKEKPQWYKDIDTRLEAVLFSHDFFLQFKEWKAALNLRLFGRTHAQVTIAPDQKNLLFNWDTDSTIATSSFYPLANDEVAKLVQEVNQTRQKYLDAGFDEVYLAIIPSKTSVVAPQIGRYNHLIERTQAHPALQTPLINCWSAFAAHRNHIYLRADTHWNCAGQSLWLDEANEQLMRHKPPTVLP